MTKLAETTLHDAELSAQAVMDKPRIALMGEFSAGKSTLANLLLEHPFSPVQATATQVPPVWYRFGTGCDERITMAGDTVPVTNDDWLQTAADDTQMVFRNRSADILEVADLIDLPGISDPNLARQYSELILPLVDMVIWCTPSNQAWRQSEAAFWAEVPPEKQQRSLLLVTRMDQVRSEIDQARILHRVTHEAGAEFGAVLPISLTQATVAGQDDDLLEACGAADMVRFLVKVLETLGDAQRPQFEPFDMATAQVEHVPDRSASASAMPRRILPRRIARPIRRQPQA